MTGLAAGLAKAGNLVQIPLKPLGRHKGSLALTAHQHAFLHQVQQGLAHRNPADAVHIAQHLFAGNARARRVYARGNIVFQPCHQLLVQGALALFF